MTEPKELRSIDELFRNTFNNLPDTPAENGWDSPSGQVWAHVQKHAKPPASGWNMQTLIILAGFAVILVVGLYFAFSSPAKPEQNQVQPTTPAIETTTVVPSVAEEPMAESHHSNSIVTAPKVVVPAATVVHRPSVKPKVEAETPVQQDVQEIKPVRQTGAAPLPGSNTARVPNTTEARKAEQAKKLEELWHTPLPLLPVPKDKKQ